MCPAQTQKTKSIEKMLTIDYQDLQYRIPKPVKRKTVVNKKTKVVTAHYPLTRGEFSASTWKEYKDWIKEQKRKETPPKPKKKKKGKTVKPKAQKPPREPKNSLTRKEQYYQQLEHPKWAEKREVILKRDQYQCRICGSHHNLQVHHIKYSPGKKAWEYPNLDLITLCKDCHEKVHQDLNHELNPYKNIEK